MNTWIVLLRAIGGKCTLPSTDFLDVLASINAKDAKTWIATGNAVFRSKVSDRDQLARKISAGIAARRGFAPATLLLTRDELAAAIKANPFREAVAVPKNVHLYFLPEQPATPDLARLERFATDGEQVMLKDGVLYLHTPNGPERTRVSAQVEKALGTWATGRNWRTSCKLLELASELNAENA